MPWQERLVVLTEAFEGLQLGSHIYLAVAVVTDVERYDSDGVASNKKLIPLLVIEHKGEDAAQVLEEVYALLAIEGKDDLTVGPRLELILSGIQATNLLMIVYFAVYSEHLLLVWREERLTATLRIDDTQTFVGKDG